ncbi:sigma-70 family RNA polymerase sigma factor [Microbacterium sp. NPDC003461]
MRVPDTDPTETTADADLVLRSRSGDADAFGELWRRHYGSAIVAARSISPSLDADDLVQEAYAKIFQAIRRGGGPTGSFRAYLFTAIRNTAAAWGGARRETAVDEMDEVEDPATSEDAVDAALDRSLTTSAFRSLPSRWQEVLWYTEVEQMKPAAVSQLLGMKPAAVSQLAFRAREGLREAWIQAHIAAVGDDSDCRWTIERLGAHARGNLGTRDGGKVDRHVADCARCTIVAAEAHDVGSRLVLVLLPLAVGVTGAAGYLASLQQDGAAPLALMAMPDGVVDGAATGSFDLIGHGAEVFGHAAEGAGALLAAAGAGTAGAAGSSSGSASGGSTTGSAWTIGGLVVAGVASIAIVGTIVANAVVPGAPAPTSEPAAIEESAAPSDASIEPDAALAAHGSDEPETEEHPEVPAPEPELPEPPALEPAPEPAPAPPVLIEAAPPAPAPQPAALPEDEAPADPVESEEPAVTDPEPAPTTPPEEPVPPPEDPDGSGEETPGETDPDPEPQPEPAIPFTLDLAASSWKRNNGNGNSGTVKLVVTAPAGTEVRATISDTLLDVDILDADVVEVALTKCGIGVANESGVATIEIPGESWMTEDDDITLTAGDQALPSYTLGQLSR